MKPPKRGHIMRMNDAKRLIEIMLLHTGSEAQRAENELLAAYDERLMTGPMLKVIDDTVKTSQHPCDIKHTVMSREFWLRVYGEI